MAIGAPLAGTGAAEPPPPTMADVAYGSHPKQVLDLWQAKAASAERPAPVVFFIHGGGWRSGNRLSKLAGFLPDLLAADLSVVSVEYRFIQEAIAEGVEPPVKACLLDAARALQFVRSKAADWHLDKDRIAACGSSAGACSSLWLAFHDDLAEPGSSDPVARESTRVCTAAVLGAQTTLDPQLMRAWTPNSHYGGHAFGIVDSSRSPQERFAEFLESRERLLPWIREYSPLDLVSADDPPVYLLYNNKPAVGKKAKDPTHSANFGVALADRLAEVGVDCEFVYPGAAGVVHRSIPEYLRATLRADRRPPHAGPEDGR